GGNAAGVHDQRRRSEPESRAEPLPARGEARATSERSALGLLLAGFGWHHDRPGAARSRDGDCLGSEHRSDDVAGSGQVCHCAGPPRRGIVLLAVMIVVAILALAGYQYADLTTAEYKVAANAQKLAQAKAVADSGIHYVLAIVASPDNITSYANGNLYSNADA